MRRFDWRRCGALLFMIWGAQFGCGQEPGAVSARMLPASRTFATQQTLDEAIVAVAAWLISPSQTYSSEAPVSAGRLGFASVQPGDYVLAVTGFDATHTVVAHASTEVEVRAGATTVVDLEWVEEVQP